MPDAYHISEHDLERLVLHMVNEVERGLLEEHLMAGLKSTLRF